MAGIIKEKKKSGAKPGAGRIGVRGRLFLSFAVIVALAVATSGFAVLSFTQLGRTVDTITTERLPPITAALQLAQATEKVVALGPALAGAKNANELKTRAGQLTEQKAKVQELLQRIETMNVDPSDFETVQASIAELVGYFGALEKNVAERLNLEEGTRDMVETVLKADTEIQKFVSLLMNVTKSEFTTAIASLETADAKGIKTALAAIAQTQSAMEPLKGIQDEARGLVSSIIEGSVIDEMQRIELLAMRVLLPIHSIKDMAATLDERQSKYLIEQTKFLEAATDKETGVFTMRLRALTLAMGAQGSIEKARILTGQLDRRRRPARRNTAGCGRRRRRRHAVARLEPHHAAGRHRAAHRRQCGADRLVLCRAAGGRTDQDPRRRHAPHRRRRAGREDSRRSR